VLFCAFCFVGIWNRCSISSCSINRKPRPKSTGTSSTDSFSPYSIEHIMFKRREHIFLFNGERAKNLKLARVIRTQRSRRDRLPREASRRRTAVGIVWYLAYRPHPIKNRVAELPPGLSSTRTDDPILRDVDPGKRREHIILCSRENIMFTCSLFVSRNFYDV
jgi:hypothetical protein